MKVDGAWTEVGFAEALARRGDEMRCARCHGRVSPYDGGGAQSHFGHYAAHAGCKLDPPALHLKALS